MTDKAVVFASQKGLVTPLEIMMAIAYTSSAEPENFFTDRMWNSAACNMIRNKMLADELIDEHGWGTEKLRRIVNNICSRPFDDRVYGRD